MLRLMILICPVLVLVVLGYMYLRPNTSTQLMQSSAAEIFEVPPLDDEYTNETFRFSMRVPEGFSVREVTTESDASILFEDARGDGVQVYITPFPNDVRELTAEIIRSSVTDMEMTEVQTVEIGDTNKGVAFISDNEAFGGASREVWFIFRGSLYQISTYARLDSLLQVMFGTWKFF